MAARLLFILTLLSIAGCGGGANILPEPFTRERADGKIPVKTELIRQQVRAVWDGTPEGEAEVARWQRIETDYNACRLSSRGKKSEVEKKFANCMSQRGYVYMYPIDAEQLHNDIEFEMDKNRDKIIAAERKAEEGRIAAQRKAEEERIAAEKKRQEEQEKVRRQKALDDALVIALNAEKYANIAEIRRHIDSGANINTKGKTGFTPLHVAAYNGKTETLLAFIKHGADINAKIYLGWTPLHFTAANGHTETLLALIKHGADIDEKDRDGFTPLHYAAFFGWTEALLALIKHGAHINAKDNDGRTPLHQAVNSGQTETLLALIKHGAHIDAKSNGGFGLLLLAMSQDKIEILHILINAGANLEIRDNEGLSPLDWAAANGWTEILRILIKAGANIGAKHNDGFTALHRATGRGHAETLLALIGAGADIDARNNNGFTPLHTAIIAGQIETLHILINAGANVFTPTITGRTPLESAIRTYGKHSKIARMLQEAITAPTAESSTIAERVFNNAWRSVVYIETDDRQGGGVIIKPNIVATNCHVVDSGEMSPAERISPTGTVVDGGGIMVYKSHNRRTDTSKHYRATIRHRDDKNDFCLLDVRGLSGVAAKVRRYDTLRIGESVYGIGAPQGLDLSLTSGLVSQKRIGNGVRYIQTDTAISPGSSGGGLFDQEGNLVGIMTSKFVDEKVEGIGFAIPADLAL